MPYRHSNPDPDPDPDPDPNRDTPFHYTDTNTDLDLDPNRVTLSRPQARPSVKAPASKRHKAQPNCTQCPDELHPVPR